MIGFLVGCAAGPLTLEVTVGEGAGVLSEQVERTVTVADEGGCEEIVVDDLAWTGEPITWPIRALDLEFSPGSGFVAETESTAVCTKGGRQDPVVATTTFTVLPGYRSDALDDGDLTAVLARDGTRLVGCGVDGDVVERDLDGGPARHLDVPCGSATRIEAQSAATAGGFVVRNDLGGPDAPRVTWVWRPPSTGVPEVLYDHVLDGDDAVFANQGVILEDRGGERVATLLSGAGAEEVALGPAADWPPQEFAGRVGSALTFVDPDGFARTNLAPRPTDLGVRRTAGTHLHYDGSTLSEVYQLVDADGAFVVLRNGQVEHRVPGAQVVPIPGAPWGAFVTDTDGVTWLAWGAALERRAPAGITVEYGNDDHWVGVTGEGDAVVGWQDGYGVLTDGLFDGSRLLPTLSGPPASRVSASNGWAIRDGDPYEISLLQIAEVAGP